MYVQMCRDMCRCVDVCQEVCAYQSQCINSQTAALVPGFEKSPAVQTDDTVWHYNARQLLEPQHVRILRSLAGDTLKDWIHNLVTIKFVVSSSDYRTLMLRKILKDEFESMETTVAYWTYYPCISLQKIKNFMEILQVLSEM